jgi:hypothetical protein
MQAAVGVEDMMLLEQVVLAVVEMVVLVLVMGLLEQLIVVEVEEELHLVGVLTQEPEELEVQE